jgi:hypothetical protein
MKSRAVAIATLLSLLSLSAPVTLAEAGCGCDKPPPPLASIRPAFASPGNTVRLFEPGIRDGVTYTVKFVDESAGSSEPAPKVLATARTLRDFADGIYKPQLVVQAPNLPPGPTRVIVLSGNTEVLKIPAKDFTMLQRPLVLPEADGLTIADCYRAAVGADGTVYLPVDISAIAEHMLFSGIGWNYPLLFDGNDIVIYNTQGVLMQLLGPKQEGIFAIADPGSPHSFELIYDRHEFETYRAKHTHQGGYGLDPRDPEWHSDGTRHIDHDHLVIAIQGIVEFEGVPSPGVTPPFTMDIATVLAEGSSGPAATTTIPWSDECSAAGN